MLGKIEGRRRRGGWIEDEMVSQNCGCQRQRVKDGKLEASDQNIQTFG